MSSSAAPNLPLVVQSDFSILADTHAPLYEDVRPYLVRFAELIRAPEHIHFYRITALSLWNAAASGMTLETIVDVLGRYSRYTLPGNVVVDIADLLSRYGKLVLVPEGTLLVLYAEDETLLAQVAADARIKPLLGRRVGPDRFEVDPALRGELKQALVELGFPPHDRAGYVDGVPLPLELRPLTLTGRAFGLRAYQHEA